MPLVQGEGCYRCLIIDGEEGDLLVFRHIEGVVGEGLAGVGIE